MSAVKSVLKAAARHSGLEAPIKRLMGRYKATGPDFYTLSPHLLVAIAGAFDQAPSLEGRAYYEFGVYRGFSIWFAEQLSRHRAPADFPIYGFDSFAGLPPSAVDAAHYHEGQFSAGYNLVKGNLDQHGADWNKIKLYPGFFSAELFGELERTERFRPVAIAVVDVDIYESTVVVLDFLRPKLVKGSILIFDDYNDMGRSDEHGERRALAEFTRATGLRLEQLFESGHECATFRVA